MSPTKRAIIILCAIAAADIGLVAGVAYPSYKNIKATTALIAEDREKLDGQLASSLALRAVSQHIAEDRARVRAVAPMLVVGSRELEFITAMEDAARRSGIEQRLQLQTTTRKSTEVPWMKEVPVAISFSGQYGAVMRHIRTLELLPYALSFTDVALSGSKGSSGSAVTVSASVNATMFVVDPTAPAYVITPAPKE